MNLFSGDLQRHYQLLLGIEEPWRVKAVDLDLPGKRVVIDLEWQSGAKPVCPTCQQNVPIHDRAPQRTWRHLDTMQFETILRARLPRCQCQEHGVKTVEAPWAEPKGRFTRLFEAFAIEVLLASRSLVQAAALLDLSWDAVYHLMGRAVARGLKRRQLDSIRHVGMDEKSFGRGHRYISVLTDLDQSRVLEVVPERTQEAAEALWQTLSEEQRRQVEAVAMDMWEAYENAARVQAPQAQIVHDKFHIAKHLNEAVDQVRRREHKQLMREGDQTLKGSKQLWLFNPKNLSQEQQASFEELLQCNLQVSRAWAIKEMFSSFWQYCYEKSARKFFDRWYGWAVRSRLKPVAQVAKMLRRHLENILTYLRHRITNAVTEGLNSKIQMIKFNARGFRSFENFRTRILFFCGKLDLYPL